jgi:general secretion pathway protein G
MILNDVYRKRSEQSPRSAFTLLEVLVVVAILVVLASVSSIYVFGYLEEAKTKKAMLQANLIAKAAKSYYANHGGSTEGLNLQALIAPPRPLLEGGTDAIKDPWGKPYNLVVGSEDTGTQNIMVTFTTPDGITYDHNGKQR